MPRYWLGIDQGSTSTKACLIDRRGKIRKLVTVPVKSRHSAPGRVEHDGEGLFRSVVTSVRRLLRGVPPGEIAAAGLTCQRSTFLIWDARSGRPLTPALSWQDRRGEDLCRALSRHEGTVRRKTGLRLSPHYSATKIRWLLDRSPALRRGAERGEVRGGTLDAYLLCRLSGGDAWSTDPTHAARTLLMDLRRRDWDPQLLELFRIPRRLLPPIRPSLFPAGELRLRRGTLRLTATLGDQQAALIGLGCLQEGDLALNYGTGAFAILNTGTTARRIPGLLTSVAWSAPGEVRYLLEGSVNSAGSALEWLRRMTGKNGKPLARGWRHADVPLVVPSFSGLGAPHWIGRARGAILDLDLATGPEDLAAGVMAGIALRIGEIVDAMRRRGLRPRRIVAGGGLAGRSDLLAFQAALLGRKIERSSITEGTCRGVALLAGLAGGELDLDGDQAGDLPMERVAPGISSSLARRFATRFRRARDLVKVLAAGE